jgi:1-acyl-sn-glycerol-3-phosphate acyltransferase
MAIEAGVPIVPVCVSTYSRHMQLNRRDSGNVLIRTLPAIPTSCLTLEQLPDLIEQCRTQMQRCIEDLDRQLSNA